MNKGRAFGLALLVALSVACAGAPPRTQVFVLGMTHSGHLDSESWGVAQVRETIAAIDPDVVCTEIPPDRWERVARDWREHGEVRDERVLRFPEYVQALLPLWGDTDEAFVIEPCAAWTAPMADARRAALQRFESDPMYAEAHRAYELENASIAARHDADPIDDGDPRVIHSDEYDARTKEELGPYDRFLNDYLGPGGWTQINAAHWALISDALDRHRGERVVITFGAGHKYWFLEQLRARDDVQLVDVRPYLPAAPHATP